MLPSGDDIPNGVRWMNSSNNIPFDTPSAYSPVMQAPPSSTAGQDTRAHNQQARAHRNYMTSGPPGSWNHDAITKEWGRSDEPRSDQFWRDPGATPDSRSSSSSSGRAFQIQLDGLLYQSDAWNESREETASFTTASDSEGCSIPLEGRSQVHSSSDTAAGPGSGFVRTVAFLNPISVALEELRALKAFGQANTDAYHRTLAACVTNKDMQTAKRLFEEMSDLGIKTPETIRLMMMLRSGLTPQPRIDDECSRESRSSTLSPSPQPIASRELLQPRMAFGAAGEPLKLPHQAIEMQSLFGPSVYTGPNSRDRNFQDGRDIQWHSDEQTSGSSLGGWEPSRDADDITNEAQHQYAGKPENTLRKKKPCKGQRDRYKKLLDRIFAQISEDPLSFDMSSLVMPPSVLNDEESRKKLIAKVTEFQRDAIAKLQSKDNTATERPNSTEHRPPSRLDSEGGASPIYPSSGDGTKQRPSRVAL